MTSRLERARKIAQIALICVAVVAGLGAGWRFVGRGGAEGLFGERVVATPQAGPVGMRPHLELPGYPRGREVTVYLCPEETTPLESCFEMGTGSPPDHIRSAPIPTVFPDGDELVPGPYVLRAGPNGDGAFPSKGHFDIVGFSLGETVRPRTFEGIAPSQLVLGSSRQVARGAECRPPVYLPDGRLAVGSTVFDPSTGVTIEMPLQASELSWSPVADKVAVLTADRKEIRLAGADARDPVSRVREARGLLSSLTWSPEGDRLAYIAQDDPETRGGPGIPTIRILNSVTGETSEAGPALAVAWSPAGDVLAIERIGPRIELGDPAGGRTELLDGARTPTWSPDGRLLGFVREAEDGSGEAWVALADGSRPARLAGGGVCAMSFSTSGRMVAMVNRADDQTTLVLHTLEVPGS